MGRLKPQWVYWSWRIYVAVVFVGFSLVSRQAMAIGDEQHLMRVLYLSPLFLPVVLANFTWWAFPFDYSLFGKYRRTPLPDESPLKMLPSSGILIGTLRAGPTTWLLYKHGIGLKMDLFGSVYLPLAQVDSIQTGGFWGRTSVISHHCPEVRGPIHATNKVAKIMAEYYPQKVLIEAEAAQ